jgi:prevent-host-death family protein
MKTVPAGKFKAHCLAILDEVAEKRERITVSKHGKPVAQVIPCPDSKADWTNPLKKSVVLEKDIISPVDTDWDADR